jgi:hypothetical protein
MAGQDPYLDDVTLLLPFTGAAGSGAIYDVAPAPSVITNSGCTIDTTQSASGCGYFDGASYLTAPTALGDFGTQDFTLEFWANLLTATSSYPYIFTTSPYNSGAGFYLYARGDGTGWGGVGYLSFSGSTTLANRPILHGSAPVRGAGWTHVAITRVGAVSRLWVDGTLDAEHTAGGVADIASSFFYLMRADGASREKGYLRDFRLTLGTARYSADFTPPDRLTVLSYPDTRSAASPIAGTATDSAGGAVDSIAVRHWDTKGLAALAVPAESGAWSADVPPGQYEVTAFVDGCQPFTHGPYTVE